MATYTFDKIEYGGNIYVPDFLPLAGGTVTGPVTFGDTITVDNATLGSLTVSGSASVANNLQVNTINGVTVGNFPEFTDTIIDGVGALSKNGNNLQVNYNDGTAVRKINSINAATVSGISGVSILYDNGGDGGAVFLPDGNGFNTGSQNIINQIPSITLNGSATTSPNFYAPTGAGTSGQYLKSNGSGAPSWTNFPTIPTIPSNNVTGSGTSGYIAKWNGTNTLTNGPQIGSGTTKFLREDGTWQTPSYTTNTDEKVKQTNTTTSSAYEILFSYTADNTERTEGARKTSTFTYNPSTKALSTGGTVNGLTLTAATTGFTIAGGTTSKTLTVSNTYTLGAACAKGVTDNSSSTAVTSTDTNLITGRTLYYAGYTKNAGTITGVTGNNGLTGSGTSGSVTIGHANAAITAQTTQAIYPIKIDAYGHITAYGSAVTIPTMPTYTVSDGLLTIG